jgi:hypothetical protein
MKFKVQAEIEIPDDQMDKELEENIDECVSEVLDGSFDVITCSVTRIDED